MQTTSGALDLDYLFRGPVEVAVSRSAWNDPDALFVGVKGGDNTFNHSHLDLGTFELDALGVRWARDLGSDSYELPGYFDFYYLTGKTGGKRWTYYRLGSLSHNIPVIGNSNQNELAKARFLTADAADTLSFVTIDLTEAYRPYAARATRGVAMVGSRRAVLVQDEFEMNEAAGIVWGMTTDASIIIDGASAVLEQQGKRLTARILEPSDARFTVESAEQMSPQAANAGVKRLTVCPVARKGQIRIAVLFSPQWSTGGSVNTTMIWPLSKWR
jgi:hypothetical protein